MQNISSMFTGVAGKFYEGLDVGGAPLSVIGFNGCSLWYDMRRPLGSGGWDNAGSLRERLLTAIKGRIEDEKHITTDPG